MDALGAYGSSSEDDEDDNTNKPSSQNVKSDHGSTKSVLHLLPSAPGLEPDAHDGTSTSAAAESWITTWPHSGETQAMGRDSYLSLFHQQVIQKQQQQQDEFSTLDSSKQHGPPWEKLLPPPADPTTEGHCYAQVLDQELLQDFSNPRFMELCRHTLEIPESDQLGSMVLPDTMQFPWESNLLERMEEHETQLRLQQQQPPLP